MIGWTKRYIEEYIERRILREIGGGRRRPKKRLPERLKELVEQRRFIFKGVEGELNIGAVRDYKMGCVGGCRCVWDGSDILLVRRMKGAAFGMRSLN